ncbi:hypothetical protein R1sor_011361 [Riccia sorocarpa]|uniref:DUF659 domain-containing protein n=1 Tax=Riccia sorocarpa TaxID=122646 RepID=A0ABD3I4B6_9MARC
MWDHTVGRRATVSCDGWTNVRGRALLNILFISKNGEMLQGTWTVVILTRILNGSPITSSRRLRRKDFDEYVDLYVTHILGYDGEKKEKWLEDVEIEMVGIYANNPKKWSEKARRNASLKTMTIVEWWSLYGKRSLSIFITMPESTRWRQRSEEQRTSVLSKFYTSKVQQEIMKKRHGDDYVASGDVNQAWVPSEKLNVPQQYTKDGRAIPAPFDWEEEVEEDEAKDNMKTAMGTSKIPGHITHFDDLKDEDFDAPTDGFFDESVDMEDLNETLASCLTGQKWKKDNEGNEIKDVLTESMAKKYYIDAEKTNMLNTEFPHRRVPRVMLNRSDILMEETKFRILKDPYVMKKTRQSVLERKPIPREKSRLGPSSSQPSGKSSTSVIERERLKLGVTSTIVLNRPKKPMDDEHTIG